MKILQYNLFRSYCRSLQLSIEYSREDPENQCYAYVTRDDLVDCFGDDVILTVQNFDNYHTSTNVKMFVLLNQ